MLMCSSVVLNILCKTGHPDRSRIPDQRVALHKKCASTVTVYPAAPPQSYSTQLSLKGCGRSFGKGGSAYKWNGRDRDRSRSTPSSTVTRPSKSGSGQANMTVTVPQEPNKGHVQSHGQSRPGKPKSYKKEWGRAPPTISTSRGTIEPVCGGVEAYNERSFCVKYHSQGAQTSFYESTPSASHSLGNTISRRGIEDSGNARANFPNASEECNLKNISRYSRVLFEHIPGSQGIWRVAPSYKLKTSEPPHRRFSLCACTL